MTPSQGGGYPLDNRIEQAILTRGEQFFQAIHNQLPSVFNKSYWAGKLLDWAMKDPDFKVQLFRFVDVFPYLGTKASLQRHLEEYFAGCGQELPAIFRWSVEKASLAGPVGTSLVARAIRSNIEGLARQFIIGHDLNEALKTLKSERKEGFAFTLDLLGEATVSEKEADLFLAGYLQLVAALAKEQTRWPALASADDLDWGSAPKINISLKPSAFYSQAKPADLEDSVRGILARVAQIYRRVMAAGGALCLDMEQYKFKGIIQALFRRLRSDEEFRHYPHLSIVHQAYLRDSERELKELLAWARGEGLPISVRLVKGAYWDLETATAMQCGWTPPVWTNKAETDIAFERQARLLLENHDICYASFASHNIRSICCALELAASLGTPQERYEFQVLYGMAEPVRQVLQKVAGRVRLYCPFGELVPGMAYLVRRLLENTSNESFLRQSFVERAAWSRLLENPALTLERERACSPVTRPLPRPSYGGLPPFENHPLIDFNAPGVREAFPRALAEVREKLGQTYPLLINGRQVRTDDLLDSPNPAAPQEMIGRVCQAGQVEVDLAVAAAQKAWPAWRATPPETRAQHLLKAAEITRRRIYELAAWLVLEVGKQWDQAYHDVAEAVDFLEYYAREMLRLGQPRRLGSKPGEHNQLVYQARGLAAVIAPWNFPLAIPCGMASAALVAGNCVIFKPASFSPVAGWHLSEIFAEAGLPAGVFNFCPGRSAVMGDYLVEHPAISLIAFTGSTDVSLRIQEKAAQLQPGQRAVKRVIAEMGGKNAIIIDDDADLDEALPHVLASAFGFQGQKCSACSRVIVLEAVYDRFLGRLLEGASSLEIGPAEDPANYLGPVVDAQQQEKILRYLDLAKQEGEILFMGQTPSHGFYVPPTIVGGIGPNHILAQEEIFGPVLVVLKAANFAQALEMANSTRQALTGGVFSRSPRHLQRARQDFRVGNLYLNRGITGALVGRQPFGGFGLSSMGFKAGGPDYLLQFLDTCCTTENTVRRGFTPISEDDDWVC